MENVVNAFGGLYAGKRVLVTGHTGFKGGWLSLWLRELGAEVHGLALPPAPEPNFHATLGSGTFARSWFADIRDSGTLASVLRESRPEIIFHLAAQPIVGVSYRSPLDTFTTNALGTALLLDTVRSLDVSAAIVVVTSDKCYRNDNSGTPFVETDPLGGHDVYSMSKAATELVAASWHASFFAPNPALGPVATARAGNVIGGGDYAEDRILPDAVRAHASGLPLVLRRPDATRPWQHVLDSVAGYLALGHRLLSAPDRTECSSYNFGPEPGSERSVVDLIAAWSRTWPDSVRVETAPTPAYAEAVRLGLDPGKAMRELGWRPVWDFEESVAHTASWYRQRHEKRTSVSDMLRFTRDQLANYMTRATDVGAGWASLSAHSHPRHAA